jgi:transcriptional regulator with XRE-family HTH domain
MASGDRQMGEKISAARRRKGWKQKDLARALEVEPTTVSRWERGTNGPSMQTIAHIANALDEPVAYFTAHLDGSAPLVASRADLATVRLEERVEALQEAVESLRVMLERSLLAGQR